MVELNHLPPWAIDYSHSVESAVIRARPGRAQRQASHRRIIIASVRRILQKSQMPYFEWFVRGELNNGQQKFIDYYIDHNGLKKGPVRIVNGQYRVDSNSIVHTVTCQLEIFE